MKIGTYIKWQADSIKHKSELASDIMQIIDNSDEYWFRVYGVKGSGVGVKFHARRSEVEDIPDQRLMKLLFD